METNFYQGCQCLLVAKQRYLAFARMHHPITGADPIRLFLNRMEYQQVARDPFFGFNDQPKGVQEDFPRFPDIVDKLLGWKLTVDLIGTYTWISGENAQHSEWLREKGFIYEASLKSWYSRPSTNRDPDPEPGSYHDILEHQMDRIIEALMR